MWWEVLILVKVVVRQAMAGAGVITQKHVAFLKLKEGGATEHRQEKGCNTMEQHNTETGTSPPSLLCHSCVLNGMDCATYQ